MQAVADIQAVYDHNPAPVTARPAIKRPSGPAM